MKASTFSVLFLLLFSAASHAANWSDFSLSYLNGSNYQVGDNDRRILTLEHAAGLTWGNTFTFVDRLE
jgi:nucleoside-specific outer membrane channel protein Tsx